MNITLTMLVLASLVGSHASAASTCPIEPVGCNQFLECKQCTDAAGSIARKLLQTSLPSRLPAKTPHQCLCTISGSGGEQSSCSLCYTITPFGAATQHASCTCSPAPAPPAPAAAPPAPPSPPPPPPTTVTQMVYSSGTTAYSNPSANGTVLLQAGTTYTVQVEILRNDLAGGYDPTRSAAYNE